MLPENYDPEVLVREIQDEIKTGFDNPDNRDLLLGGGYSVTVIPQEMFAPRSDMSRLAGAIEAGVKSGVPAATPMQRAVYRIMVRLADKRIRASSQTLSLGMTLAAGKLAGEPIQTHLRDLAREAGVRYQTLLAVRRAAIAELGKMGIGRNSTPGKTGTYSISEDDESFRASNLPERNSFKEPR